MTSEQNIGFTEYMSGTIREAAVRKPRSQFFGLRLQVKIPNLESFLDDPAHTAELEGLIEWGSQSRTTPLRGASFQILAPSEAGNELFMTYTGSFRIDGCVYAFEGRKVVHENAPTSVWEETTQLHTRIWPKGNKDGSDTWEGTLTLTLPSFLRQLASFRSSAPTLKRQITSTMRFAGFFTSQLASLYFGRRDRQRAVTRGSHAGVHGLKHETHTIETEDGLTIRAERFGCQVDPGKGTVILLHGLTTSTDMFTMPEHVNLVQSLYAAGFQDIWSVDWRGSNRLPYNAEGHLHTIDDVALYDLPAAFRHVQKITQSEVDTQDDPVRISLPLHVICHCVGSLAYHLSAVSGLLPPVTSVVTNSVSLQVKVPDWSRAKLMFAPFLARNLLNQSQIAPTWGSPYLWSPYSAPLYALARVVDFFHPECPDRACHMTSFMWGSGRPACFLHNNMAHLTHERLGDLFGPAPLGYYPHIRTMVSAGQNRRYRNIRAASMLTRKALDQAMKTGLPPTLFMTGTENHVFCNSNTATYDLLKTSAHGFRHELFECKGYGHQDVFMGKSAAEDIFPRLIDFMTRQLAAGRGAAGAAHTAAAAAAADRKAA